MSSNKHEHTLEIIEGMTPVIKTKEKVEAEQQHVERIEEKDNNKSIREFEGQLTQLEASFTLDKVIPIFFSKLVQLIFIFGRSICILTKASRTIIKMKPFFV